MLQVLHTWARNSMAYIVNISKQYLTFFLFYAEISQFCFFFFDFHSHSFIFPYYVIFFATFHKTIWTIFSFLSTLRLYHTLHCPHTQLDSKHYWAVVSIKKSSMIEGIRRNNRIRNYTIRWYKNNEKCVLDILKEMDYWFRCIDIKDCSTYSFSSVIIGWNFCKCEYDLYFSRVLGSKPKYYGAFFYQNRVLWVSSVKH